MKLRDYIGAVARSSAESGIRHGFRRLMTGAAAVAHKSPLALVGSIADLAKAHDLTQAEHASWADPAEIGTDNGRRKFDVCDLRIWLDLAERAGVDAIPAIEVARLEEAELEALLGEVRMPKALRGALERGMGRLSREVTEQPVLSEEEADAVHRFLKDFDNTADSGDLRSVAYARIDGALDDIPASWMVRTHLSGSGNLKTLVGTGLMQKGDDTARITPEFELGAGWVRAGNRRIIDFADPRFLQSAIGGHKGGITYLARPWAEAARFHDGEDVHRAGSPIAGPGKWPAEWRVFVRSGEVTGVANYYGWTGDGATSQNAWNAIRAAAMAQKIVDTAGDLGLIGSFMNQVRIRGGNRSEVIERLDRDWPADQLHAALDFFEGQEGMLFLEAGPAHQPGGGGHPCAFAGQGLTGDPVFNVSRCEGVAYRAMAHVDLGEPSTWRDADPEGAIEGWAEAAARAAEYAPMDDDMMRLLSRHGVDVSGPGGPEI